jgi:hypothetical protein
MADRSQKRPAMRVRARGLGGPWAPRRLGVELLLVHPMALPTCSSSHYEHRSAAPRSFVIAPFVCHCEECLRRGNPIQSMCGGGLPRRKRSSQRQRIGPPGPDATAVTYPAAIRSPSTIQSSPAPCGSVKATGEPFTDSRNRPGVAAILTRPATSGKTRGDSLDIQ